jgi:hypothetical protein
MQKESDPAEKPGRLGARYPPRSYRGGLSHSVTKHTNNGSNKKRLNLTPIQHTTVARIFNRPTPIAASED